MATSAELAQQENELQADIDVLRKSMDVLAEQMLAEIADRLRAWHAGAVKAALDLKHKEVELWTDDQFTQLKKAVASLNAQIGAFVKDDHGNLASWPHRSNSESGIEKAIDEKIRSSTRHLGGVLYSNQLNSSEWNNTRSARTFTEDLIVKAEALPSFVQYKAEFGELVFKVTNLRQTAVAKSKALAAERFDRA